MSDWTFEQSGHYGDWRGTHTASGKRTALKSNLRAAQADVEQGRLVCSAYPYCSHYSADGCSRESRFVERGFYGSKPKQTL